MGTAAKGFMKGVTRSLARNMQSGMDAEAQAGRDRALDMKRQNLARYTQGLATEENIRKEGVAAEESALDRASKEKIAGMKGSKSKEDTLSRKDAMKYAYDYGGAEDPEQALRIADQLQGKTVAEMEAVKEDKGYWGTLWAAVTGQEDESGAPQLAGPAPVQAAESTQAPTVGGETAPAAPAAPAPPAAAKKQAPQGHIDYLMQKKGDPKVKQMFMDKYGYLPPGV